MRIVAAPDGAVNRIDRALWMTPIFDLAFATPVAAITGASAPAGQVYVGGGIAGQSYIGGGMAGQSYVGGGMVGQSAGQ